MPEVREMETIRRPLVKAQEFWVRAQDEGQRAYRTAYAVLKQMMETAGDQWEQERARRPRATAHPAADRHRSGRPSRRTTSPRRAGASKTALLEEAKRLEVPGRSRMSKEELIRAIQRAKRKR